MSANPIRLLAFCEELEKTSAENLHALDRETLLGIRKRLIEHKRRIDRLVLRLSFVAEQQLN